MEYRKANLEDVNQLTDLREKQLIDEGCHGENNITDELKKFFSSGITNKSLSVWIAYEDETIIGTCGVCLFQYPPTYRNPTGQVAYLTNVYTRDEYRRQGVATKLLEYTMEEIKSKGYKIVRLHASRQGQKLYKNLGFSNVDGIMAMEINNQVRS